MRVDANILDIWHPHAKQLQFLLSWRRYELALTGVGWGKSWCLALKCLIAGLGNTQSTVLLAGRTYKDLTQVLVPQLRGHIKAFQDATGVALVKKWNKLDNRIDLLGGGSILLRSYQNNPDGLAGLNLSAAFVDEVEVTCADRDKVFGIVSERCRVQDTFQTIAFASTPNGLMGVAKKFWQARLNNDHDYHLTTGTSLDNPYTTDSFKKALCSNGSKSRHAQQVLGQILRPTNVVFPEATDEILIDWDWKEHPELPWVLIVDWGSGNHNFAGMMQVLPDGTWIAADELIADECPRGQFRKLLKTWIKSKGADPVVACTDRACPDENSWLRGAFIDTHVRSCETGSEQYVINGLELVRDQLAPVEGPPTFRVAKSLRKIPSETTAGIWQALTSYRWRLDREGNPTLLPLKDNLTDHAMDAIRYGYVKTRNSAELHGGKTLSMTGLGPDGNHEDPSPEETRERHPRW